MTNLLSLIEKITHFYKTAASSYLKTLGQAEYGMPEDPEADEADLGLYDDIMDAARQIADVDVLSEVLLIAELYKKALEIGGGFNAVNKAISNLVNMMDDEDNEEQMAVEDLMNKVSRDLRNRAKATPMGDSDEAVKALRQVKDEINTRLISEDLEPEQTPFEAGMEGEVVFDPTGGVSPEVGKAKGRGYRVETRSFKDWAQSYENERQRYEHELTAPELQLSRTGLEARRNASSRNNLKELVSLLSQMVELTKEATRLETELQAVPDPDKQARLETVRNELRKMQSRRIGLKKNLRNYQYDQQVKSLTEEAAAARTPQEKFLLEQRIKLTELMMSPDRGKAEEAKYRRMLINSMTGGHAIPPEQVARIQAKIQEGAAKKRKATQLYREKAEQVAAQKGTKETIKTREELLEGGARAPRRGLGAGRIHDYDFDLAGLEGLITHLTQRMATERIVVKQKITDKLKKAQQDATSLKPFMDDLAKAATKKDRTAFLASAQRLRTKMDEFKNVQPEMVQYVISLRTSKFFYSFRDKAKQIGEWLGQPMSAEQVSFIDDTIREGRRLVDFYKSLKVKPITPGWAERTTHYKPPTEIIEKIVKNLEGIKYGS